MAQLTINNGVDVNPSFTETIVISRGTVNTPIRKDAVSKVAHTINTNPDYYKHDVVAKIFIHGTDGGTLMEFDVQDVDNQAGWTADINGLRNAVNDINSWL